jgi:flagellar hook assembly protein FlgD
MITPGEQKLQVLDFPSEYYTPTGEQMTAQWDNIMRSQYVPFMQTIPSAGIQVPLSAITTFLGLTEDVSPVIKYEIDFSDEVEIVIYSIQARVVRTMFKGNQTPGTYKFTWNGLDDYGRKMLTGDYIGEVRIGKSRYVRKHIQIP